MNDEASVTIQVTDSTAAEVSSVLDALCIRAADTPDAIAFADSPDREERSLGSCRIVTYGQAATIVEQVRRGFLDLGLAPGDIIAIQAPNIVEVPLAVLGAWSAGLVPSLMPVLWQLDEIDHAFALTKPKAAITVSNYGPEQPAITFGEAAARHLSIRFVMALGDAPPDGIAPIDSWFDAPDEPQQPQDNEEAKLDDSVPAILTWMAGRLGNQPVPHTHHQILTLARMFVSELDMRRRDIILNPYPYANIGAIVGQLAAPVLAGAQTVLHLPFDFTTYVGQLEQQRITCAIAPAPVISALEDRRDLHSTKFKLRKLGCVWPSPHAIKPGPGLFEPVLPTTDIHSFAELAVLPRRREPGMNPSLLPLGKIRQNPDQPDSTVLLETRIRGSVTTQEEKQILKGTLTVRGTTVPEGTYQLDRPGSQQSDRKLPYQADAQGFVDTGIGAVAGDDIAGYFRCQKSEDIIYHGGTALSASDLDLLYATFDEFLDAAAFAIEDAALGERIFAAVVPQPDLSPSLDRFKDYLAHKRVAPYKVPDQLIIVRSIPRNSDGAVLRDQILSQI